jgi:hypothetical protein
MFAALIGASAGAGRSVGRRSPAALGVWWYARAACGGVGAGLRACPARGRFPGNALRDRNLALLTAGYFCLNYFSYIFYYWIYYYFGEIRGMSQGESATYVTFLMLTITVMTPLGGWVADALSPRMGRHKARRLVSVIGLSLSAVLLYVGSSGLDIVTVSCLLAAGWRYVGAPFGRWRRNRWGNAGAAGGIMNGGNAEASSRPR